MSEKISLMEHINIEDVVNLYSFYQRKAMLRELLNIRKPLTLNRLKSRNRYLNLIYSSFGLQNIILCSIARCCSWVFFKKAVLKDFSVSWEKTLGSLQNV